MQKSIPTSVDPNIFFFKCDGLLFYLSHDFGTIENFVQFDCLFHVFVCMYYYHTFLIQFGENHGHTSNDFYENGDKVKFIMIDGRVLVICTIDGSIDLCNLVKYNVYF